MNMEELSNALQSNDFLERSLSNDDDPNVCAVSDSSTTCSGGSSSGDSISDDELQQESHPLTSSSSSSSGQHRALNASGKTFRRLHERSDSGQIRSKLLMKLGIELGGGITNGTSTSTEASRVVQKGQEDAYNIALKRDHGQVDRNIQHSKKPIESLSTMPGNDKVIEKSIKHDQRAICFDASVKVHPIPARSDYSNRMKSVMWVSSTEIQQNAARNSLEFAAEEWDVSKVVNDEDMILYGGELIHPIHFIQHNEIVSSNGASGK